MIDTALTEWHRLVAEGDYQGLDQLLADDAVFHSPVVHTPQVGKPITKMYLSAAFHVLGGGGFKYVREVVQGHEAVLEFETEIDGVHVNGVDMIRFNDAGQIVDFKVLVRPVKAIELLHRLMADTLSGNARKDGNRA